MVRPIYTGRIMQVARNWRGVGGKFQNGGNGTALEAFFGKEKSTLLLWCWFPRHLSSVGYVQVLDLYEHFLYPAAKRPLALCIEVLIPVSKFVCCCIYKHRRIIHLISSAKTN